MSTIIVCSKDLIGEPKLKVNPLCGYIYNNDGMFLEHIPGSEDVYLAKPDTYTLNQKKTTKYLYSETPRYLQISHSDFTYISGVLSHEDSSSFEAAAAVTQTTFNAVAFLKKINDKQANLTVKQQAKYASAILKTSFSSVFPKKSLDDKSITNEAKNARKALIHVLLGNRDYSNGAVRWDGIDFADKGPEHIKVKREGGISLTKQLWRQFVDCCDFFTKGQLKYGKKETKEVILAKFPFGKNLGEVKKKIPNTQMVTRDLIEIGNPLKKKDKKTGKDIIAGYIILNKAVAVVGKQIYWAPYEDYQNNKTLKYNWKWYFGKSFI